MFDCVGHLNDWRALSYDEYNHSFTTLDKATIAWATHKSLSIITLPMNVCNIGIGIFGMGLSACTIGAAKIAIYALSLGNVRLQMSTGITWLGYETAGSLFEVGSTMVEWGHDGYVVCKKTVQGIKAAMDALHLTTLYNKICAVVKHVFTFIRERLEAGLEDAIDSEWPRQWDGRSIPLITPLNDFRGQFVQDDLNKRSLGDIAAHTVISVVSLPVNAVSAICALAVNFFAAVGFSSKVLLSAGTNLSIPIPTFLGEAFSGLNRASTHLLANGAVCALDIPISLYKISEATGLFYVAVTVMQVVSYIPIALFEAF